MKGTHRSKVVAPRGKDISSMKKPEKESESKIHLKELKSRKRTNLALFHLDRAEKLALDLLKICGDTAEKFAELTQIDEGIRTSTGLLVVEKQEQIQQNGKEFREKIEEIHNLIVPHVKLVKNYTKDVENRTNPVHLDAMEKSAQHTESGPTRNMYSSRLELKLESERQTLLKEMMCMEKEKMSESAAMSVESEERKDEQQMQDAFQDSKKRKR